MIIFFEHGRLGNQLFQYCGLRHYCSGQKLVFIGCEDLQRHFESVDARFIPKNTLRRWFPFSLLRRIVFFLVAVRLLGQITEEKDSEVYNLAVRKGLFWNTYIAQNIFFQHRDVVEQIHNAPSLKPELLKVALGWLNKKGVVDSLSAVFVHVRRGDYLHWPSDEFPAVLDLVWYERAIKAIQEKNKNAVIIMMSDDLFYLNDIFNESDRLLISDNPPEIDMALMSLCHSGVLSASSFAWWGAFYARLNQKVDSTFLAPQYWCGHRAKKWYPSNFCNSWINYLE